MPGTVLSTGNMNSNRTACLLWNKLWPTEKGVYETDEQKLLLCEYKESSMSLPSQKSN